jgi:UrcA family protein
MTKSFTTFAGAALVAASALAMSAPAFAQSSPDQGSSVRVSYSDLDVGHAQGLRVLKSRVEAAAHKACGGDVDIRDLDRRALVEQCRTEAVGHAMSQFSSSTYAYAGPTSSGR